MSRRRLGLAGAIGVVLALVAIQAVFAHSRPIYFDPPPGAVLDSAPAQVRGWFTSDIRRDPNWSFLRVTDAQGNRVDAGETQLSADRRQMTVALRPGLAPGRYLVTWRTFDDADGEIFGDCYYFFVGQAAADAHIAGNARLDGGSACERIEVSAANGTPVPGQTLTPSEDSEPDAGNSDGNGGNDGVPAWTLILGVLGGAAVGLVGGRLLGANR